MEIFFLNIVNSLNFNDFKDRCVYLEEPWQKIEFQSFNQLCSPYLDDTRMHSRTVPDIIISCNSGSPVLLWNGQVLHTKDQQMTNDVFSFKLSLYGEDNEFMLFYSPICWLWPQLAPPPRPHLLAPRPPSPPSNPVSREAEAREWGLNKKSNIGLFFYPSDDTPTPWSFPLFSELSNYCMFLHHPLSNLRINNFDIFQERWY